MMLGFDSSFREQVDRLSGQEVATCYHCHTCSAGCPASTAMELGPDRILRLIELGHRERALQSKDIWLCASCETCASRCPNDIDVARVMDTLRHLSLVSGFPSPDPHTLLFHRLYMQVVKALGRSSEALILGLYKVLSRDLLSDMDAGLGLILKGKIPLIPKRIKDASGVKRIFEAAAEVDESHLKSART